MTGSGSARAFTVEEPWDQFPIVGDLLAIWAATGRYVSTYVDHAHPTDRDVRQDRQLGQWMAESTDEDGGNIRGLPAMDSKDALERSSTASSTCSTSTSSSGPRRPTCRFVPIGGIDPDLFFDDDVINGTLMELRQFVVSFVERVEPGTPQVWQVGAPHRAVSPYPVRIRNA